MSKPDYTKLIQKLDNINKKLETLIKLVAITSSMETTLKKKSQKEKIKILSDLGLSRNLTAFLLGTTPLTVRVTLSQMKKGKKQRKKTVSASKEEKVD